MARSSSSQAWAVGGVVFAATMMIMLGVWQVIVGIAAIAEDSVFVTTPDYTYDLDTTAWGWIHLVLGAVVAVTGFFLYTGAAWARAVGIVLASLSAIANFLFLPYYPLWALVVIALDVFVIWALATAGYPRRTDDELVGRESGGYRSQEGYRDTESETGGNGFTGAHARERHAAR
ncbi:MAG: DUF7144 family membrane protein [Natronosporangium sp.]